jgi:flagellar motor switch protein FliM
LGRTKENYAVRITEKLKRPDSVKTELELVTRQGKRITNDVSALEELEDE